MGDLPLKERFPRLYAISLCKENVLKELGKWEGEVCKWNLLWRREMFTWEREISQQLFVLINNSCTKWQDSSVSDNCIWSQDSLHVYTVRGIQY